MAVEVGDYAQDLSLTLSTGTVSFGTVVPSGSPYTVGRAVTVTVQANVPYHLPHSATALVRSGGAEALPPLQYAEAGSGSFADFPGAAATIKSGGPTAGASYAFGYRVTVPWTGPWNVLVSAQPPRLAGGAAELPPTEYREGTAEFRPFPAQPSLIAWGPPTAGETHVHDYRQQVPFTAPPGRYAGTVTYAALAR